MLININENINLIQEKLSSILYHFTTIGRLLGILKNNEFELTSKLERASDNLSKKYYFYACFTRQKNGRLGYAKHKDVRITFDGDLLNSRYSGKALDYWGSFMGKNFNMNPTPNKNGTKTYDYTPSSTESEDRLFANEPVITNVIQYIKRIDVFIDNSKSENLGLIHEINLYSHSFNIFIYNNERDFKNQTNNTINQEIKDNWEKYYVPKQEMAHGYNMGNGKIIDVLEKILRYISYISFDGKNINAQVGNLLREYNLTPYINGVVKKLKTSTWYTPENVVRNFLEATSDLKDCDQRRDVQQIKLLVKDFCQKYHITDFESAFDLYAKKGVKNQNHDWSKKIKVLAYVRDYYNDELTSDGVNKGWGATVILHPETTSIWDVPPFNDEYQKEYFMDETPYHVNSHNSKDDEHFKKYLKHLTKKCSVSDYINFVDSVDIDDDDKSSVLLQNGSFKYLIADVNFAWDATFINDEERKEFEQYFVKLNENKQPKKVYINEDKLQLLQEGAESKNMKLAKHYLYDNCGYNEEKAMQTIGAIKTDIPNVRLAKCKFILGVTRMFYKNELSDERAIMGINKALKYIASDAHVNEYNNDLNGLSCNEIIQRFASVASADLENEKNELSQMEFNQSDYEIVKIPDFDTASQYGDYTDWCVTQYEDMYANYTHGGLGLFYFCLKRGYEDVEEIKGEGCPLDEYGLSMIAVSVNEDGSCNTITCRWNHSNGGNDSIMTPKELSQIIGYDFYQVFKPYSLEEINEKRQKLLSLFAELAVDNLYNYSDNLDMLSDCCELCYDKDYDEDYEGEYYDINGELCNTEDDYGGSYHYQLSHLKYIIVSSEINEELEEKLGNAYLIYEYSYGDFTLMFNEIFTEAEYLEKSNQFILKKGNKATLYDCDNCSFIISEEDNIESIIKYPFWTTSLGVIKKGGYCYFYDFESSSIYDETPYKNVKAGFNNGKFPIVINENNEENIYSSYIKNVALEKWYQKIVIYDTLLACIDGSSYTLYVILGTNIKKITDNQVVGLYGYRCDGYLFDYKEKGNRYIYNFKTRKVYKYDVNTHSASEEVNLLNNGINENKHPKKVYINENKLSLLQEELKDAFYISQIRYKGENYSWEDGFYGKPFFTCDGGVTLFIGDYGTTHEDYSQIKKNAIEFGRIWEMEDKNIFVMAKLDHTDTLTNQRAYEIAKMLCNKGNYNISNAFYVNFDIDPYKLIPLETNVTRNTSAQNRIKAHNSYLYQKLAYRDHEGNIRTDKEPMTLAQYHSLIYQENKKRGLTF